MKKTLLGLTALLGACSLHAQISQSDIILYLDFDGDLTDASANGIVFNQSSNATNAITYETGAPFTGSGTSGNFNQSSYVSTTSGFFNHLNSHTIAAWIKVDQLSSLLNAGQTVLHQKDVTGENPGRIHLEILAGDQISSLSTFQRVTNASDVTADTWYHVATVVDRTDVNNPTHTLYINGVQVDQVTAGTESNDGALVLGSFKDELGAYLYGNVDDLLITSEVLTATQINDVMNNGVAVEAALSTADFTMADTTVKVNVANGMLTYQTQLEVTGAAIYNVTGQKIAANVTGKQINVSALSTGVYFLSLESNKGTTTKKFVVN